MDDFLVAATNQTMARELLDKMITVAEGLGFTIQEEKVEIGPALVFAGVLFESKEWSSE